MHTLNGGCHCGNIQLELRLVHAPATYNPRACDCDFCRRHAAAYVSDPRGSLAIRLRDQHLSGRYRQGNGLAEFLLCMRCGVLVAALYRNGAHLYASANARAVGGGGVFGAPQPVSPKTLAADEKQRRWQAVWFADVSLANAGA